MIAAPTPAHARIPASIARDGRTHSQKVLAPLHWLARVPLPTLGGLQFWSNEFWHRGWRIQRHALFGHCRLIDPCGIRRDCGSYERCEATFRRLVERRDLKPRSDEFVVIVHGLGRTRRSHREMEDSFAGHGYEVVPFQYASTRKSVEQQAATLARMMGRLQGARRIHFVTHSLGGLIVRRYLAQHRDPRIGRLVMIAPPNQGARMARLLKDCFLCRAILGPALRQLAPGGMCVRLPAPWCEFGVIAGGRETKRGWSPFIPGDDDGLVGVDETHLCGMKDFLIVRSGHTLIMNKPRVIRAALSFIEEGRFR